MFQKGMEHRHVAQCGRSSGTCYRREVRRWREISKMGKPTETEARGGGSSCLVHMGLPFVIRKIFWNDLDTVMVTAQHCECTKRHLQMVNFMCMGISPQKLVLKKQTGRCLKPRIFVIRNGYLTPDTIVSYIMTFSCHIMYKIYCHFPMVA